MMDQMDNWVLISLTEALVEEGFTKAQNIKTKLIYKMFFMY